MKPPSRLPAPIWEVFEPRGGRTVGYAQTNDFNAAISIVAMISGVENRALDAILVPIARLDAIPGHLLTI